MASLHEKSSQQPWSFSKAILDMLSSKKQKNSRKSQPQLRTVYQLYGYYLIILEKISVMLYAGHPSVRTNLLGPATAPHGLRTNPVGLLFFYYRARVCPFCCANETSAPSIIDGVPFLSFLEALQLPSPPLKPPRPHGPPLPLLLFCHVPRPLAGHQGRRTRARA